MALKIEIEQKPQAVVAKLSGEAGVDEADELDRSLRLLTAAKPALAILDMAGLSYIASMGIGALVKFRNEIAHAGGQVAFAPIEILEQGPDGVWVSGLAGPVNLIVAGQAFVAEGQTVRVKAEGAPAPVAATPAKVVRQ